VSANLAGYNIIHFQARVKALRGKMYEQFVNIKQTKGKTANADGDFSLFLLTLSE
jgi:hypothetical protein